MSPVSREDILFGPHVARHPSSRVALAHLRSLGKPPSSVNSRILLDRSPVLLSVIITLGVSLYGPKGPREVSFAMSQVRTNWDSSLSPWLQFLIRELILWEEGPSTPEGVEILEQSLAAIPIFLLEVVLRDDNILKPLQSLVIRAWIKTIRDGHSSWGLWSHLSGYLTESTKRDSVESRGDYCENDQTTTGLGLVFVSHLNRTAQQVEKMELESLDDLRCFIICHNHDRTWFDGSLSPMYCPEVGGAAISGLVRILCGIIKRKFVSDSDLEEKEVTHQLLRAALGHMVFSHVTDPLSVEEALRTGIIKALLELPLTRAWDSRLEEVSRKIIDQVSIFLLYPTVLRRFWKSNRKIIGSGAIEGDSKQVPTGLWNCWKSLEAKAVDIRTFRQTLKSRVSPLCSYSNVGEFFGC
ncbi:hypothetical protein AAF712_015711 [Marasmius tenuissimus]|uniref:Uncharacterized protein n=1 Tax=Marasmius tenuissimus TaxID=585030 RepID=A0ABR2Z8H4_9AGAR